MIIHPAAVLFAASALLAGQPAAPGQTAPKRIPPPGIDIPAADRAELETQLKDLGAAVDALRRDLRAKPELLALLPDVEVYHSAVRVALKYNEILDAKEIPAAKNALKRGLERAAQLKQGAAPWAEATGLVVRAYVSRIDGSLQPYGLVVPPEFKPGGAPRRLDFWFHGRNEKLTELNFITDREKSAGEFTPPGAIVLHLYGRFCNANHFAAETDLFEALADVKKRYPIDEDRIVVRGFSMGGAACWHFATHHAGLWAAAAPGAGFAETAQFSKLTVENHPWYERKLWHIYDATDYAVNLFNCPTVAYSGEIDKQKQAADVMAKAMLDEGLTLTHIIGPQTAHKYHPDSKKEINAKIDPIVAAGRERLPKKIRFTTWTLRYNEMKWLAVDGMEKHWERARVDAEIVDKSSATLTTQNVSALMLSMRAGDCPFERGKSPRIAIDGTALQAPAPQADCSWTAHFRKTDKTWAIAEKADDGQLRKRHGLQGPIDDAFMDSFVMVRPTGKPQHEAAGAWTAKEMARAIEHWRRIFRGETPVIDDTAVTEQDISSKNLVLWGDAQSNAVLARIAAKLPIAWDAKSIRTGGKSFSSEDHVLAMIFPNPLNPRRYVVLNSGFTFMDNSSASNARHIAMLPDWAVINVKEPPESKVKDANFFGERWELVEHP